tara:strand:+ start:9188 stop:9685 length:498 start_codon:yes stop_codon:yes gene_type:complete
MTNKIKHVTQERLKELFKLTDKGLVWKVNRSGVTIGKGSIVHKSTGYKLLKVDYRQYREHRLVWLYVYGTLPKTLDHIDGNKENNNIKNLREATISENMQNMKISSANTSGVKGVTWNKKRQKWRARVRLNKKEYAAGFYKNLEEAQIAVCKLREKLHGEFTNNG